MSVSAKDNIKMTKTLKKNKTFLSIIPKRGNSTEKNKNYLSLKNTLYKINTETKINKDLTILNL